MRKLTALVLALILALAAIPALGEEDYSGLPTSPSKAHGQRPKRAWT